MIALTLRSALHDHRDDGLVVAGVNGSYEEDLWVFEPGGTEPIVTYEFGHLPNDMTRRTTWKTAPCTVTASTR